MPFAPVTRVRLLASTLVCFAAIAGCQDVAAPSSAAPEGIELQFSCQAGAVTLLRSTRLWLPTDGSPTPDTVRLAAYTPNGGAGRRCALRSVVSTDPGGPIVLGAAAVGDSFLDLAFAARSRGLYQVDLRTGQLRSDRLSIFATSRAFAERGIGHAGAGQLAPENSLSSLRLSERAGLWASEIDIRLTADSVPVLMHDETVDRTTNGSGPVSGMPSSDVLRLELASTFSDGYVGEYVPSLDSVLAATSASGLRLVFDIKPQTMLTAPAYARMLVSLVEKHGAIGRVFFESGSVALLKEIRKLSPSAQLMFFSWGRQPWEMALVREARLAAVMHHPDSLLLESMTPLLDSLSAQRVLIMATNVVLPAKADSLLQFRRTNFILADLPPRVFRVPYRPR